MSEHPGLKPVPKFPQPTIKGAKKGDTKYINVGPKRVKVRFNGKKWVVAK